MQKGAFGACLMKESTLVANCVKAMKDAVSIDVTVKHRIGIDDIATYSFVRDFIGEIARGRMPNLHCPRQKRHAERLVAERKP